jgi:hypothetical protein
MPEVWYHRPGIICLGSANDETPRSDGQRVQRHRHSGGHRVHTLRHGSWCELRRSWFSVTSGTSWTHDKEGTYCEPDLDLVSATPTRPRPGPFCNRRANREVHLITHASGPSLRPPQKRPGVVSIQIPHLTQKSSINRHTPALFS